MCRRGYLKKGYSGDIVIFDKDVFAENADFSEPRAYSVGVAHLFVNGIQVIENGRLTDKLVGAPISRLDCEL